MNDTSKSRFKGLGGELRANRKVSIYLVCVLIASIFWTLNALTKRYSTSVQVPIRYQNFPENFVFEKDLPNSIATEIEGYGFNLLFFNKYGQKDSVSMNLNRATTSIDGGLKVYKIPTKASLPSLADEISSNIQVKKFWEDTLYIKAESKWSKNVKLAAQLDLSFERQHVKSGPITIEPARVNVVGPKSIVESIDSVLLESISLENLNDDIHLEARILGVNGVSIDREVAQVHIPVDQTTEMSFELPIEKRNVPDSLQLMLFPTKVNVVLELPLSLFETMNKKEVVLVVDYDEYTAKRSSLIVEVESLPPFVKLKRFSPNKVEVIVRK